MKTYFLLRHGYTGIVEHKQKPDSNIQEEGILQAQQTAEKLTHMNIQKIVTSTMARAHQTAEIVAKELELPVNIDRRLEEIPLWLTPQDLHNDFNKHQQKGIETLEMTLDQNEELLNELNAEADVGTYLIVAHGNRIRSLLYFALKMSLETLVRMRLANGSLTVLQWDDDSEEPFFWLERLNDTVHLEQAHDRWYSYK